MPSRLDPKLLAKLARRVGKPAKYVREQISKRALKHRVSSEAYFVHWLISEKIGAATFRKNLSPQIQGEVMSLSGNIPNSHPQQLPHKSAEGRSKPAKRVLQVNKLEGVIPKAPLLPSDTIKEATENSSIYPVLFLFENSLRNFIEAVLKQRYGAKWWKTNVPTDVQTTVKERMQKEKLNPWHGSRGVTEIFYSDFADLVKILNRNAGDFNPFFKHLPGGLSWLTQKLRELALSRNNIAHSTALKKQDRERFMVYFRDWYAQIDQLNEQI